MSGCSEIRDELKAYLDRELPTAERARVRTHLDACPDCRREMETMMRLGEKLSALDQAVPRPELRARILAQLPDAPPPKAEARRAPFWGFRLPAYALAAGSVAIVGLLAGYVLTRPSDVRAPVVNPRITASAPSGSLPKQIARNDSPALPESKHKQDTSVNGPTAVPLGEGRVHPQAQAPKGKRVSSAMDEARQKAATPPAVAHAGRGDGVVASKPATPTAPIPALTTAGPQAQAVARRKVASNKPAESDATLGRRVDDLSLQKEMEKTRGEPLASSAISGRANDRAGGSMRGGFGGAAGAAGPPGAAGPQGPPGVPSLRAAPTPQDAAKSYFYLNQTPDTLVLTVDDIEAQSAKVAEAAKEAGGYVERSERPVQVDGAKAITLTVAVPQDHAESLKMSLGRAVKSDAALALGFGSVEGGRANFGMEQKTKDGYRLDAPRDRAKNTQEEVQLKAGTSVQRPYGRLSAAPGQNAASNNTNARKAKTAVGKPLTAREPAVNRLEEKVENKGAENRERNLKQETDKQGKEQPSNRASARYRDTRGFGGGAANGGVESFDSLHPSENSAVYKRALGTEQQAGLTRITVLLRETPKPAASAAPKAPSKK